ncbi:tRNA-dihydrouridine synthase [Candidatus Peregrinibacteria bacterium]|nr:tRNA-dihydrouridine synthase [Candidatus Peregrinibacteria bacterium]
MEKGFWAQLEKPIIGLAPMDGVTDAPFRFMATKYGKPHVIMTEFTSVEGLCYGNEKGLKAFLYDQVERPVVAQIFGSNPESFYKVAFIVSELGFDGIDINMGCPAKNVASKGSGAALIQTPEIAKEIIRQTRKGTQDWANGKTMEDAGLPENIIQTVQSMQPKRPEKRELPVSVKTRIGFNSNVAVEWAKHLLETEPVNISIHGRTLKQMYTGSADWDAIAAAAEVIKKTDTTVLGNGDVESVQDGLERVKKYGVDGFMIGRAAFGNPWVFNREHAELTLEDRLTAAKEHSHKYEEVLREDYFYPMRKHLAWYCKGFYGASEIRKKLMKAENAKEVEQILNEISAMDFPADSS